MGDIAWLQPSGETMGEDAWGDGEAKRVMVFLNGGAIPTPDSRGRRVVDDDFLVLFNGDHEDHTFTLPGEEFGERWVAEIDTAVEVVDPDWHAPRSEILIKARSVVVLRDEREAPTVPAGASTTTRS